MLSLNLYKLKILFLFHRSNLQMMESQYRRGLEDSMLFNQMNRKNKKRQQQIQNQRYNRVAIDSFPFGKQSIKLAKYVSDQLSNKQQQENARILEQFRRKAIEDKFHHKYGHLKNNSHLLQKYITQNMLPGVTANPSMVNNYEPELKIYQNQSQVYQHSPISHNNFRSIKQPQRQFTQPASTYAYTNTIDTGALYNARKRYVPQTTPYQMQYEPRAYSIIENPENFPLKTTQCQTLQGDLTLSKIRTLKQIDLERKYYKTKLKLKSSNEKLKKFDKLQQMLYQLNHQINQNSKYLHRIVIKGEKQKSSRRNQSKNSTKYVVKYPHARIKTEQKSENKQLKNWKLNNEILYDSTGQSFFHSKTNPRQLRPKPQIQYTKSNPYNSKSKKYYTNFSTPNKKLSKNFEHQSTKDYKLKAPSQDEDSKSGVDKIRQHLKLLKRNTDRLETLNSYSLVQ